MIKNIVFDIGKVLVRFDWEDYLASFQFPEKETTAIAKAMFLPRAHAFQMRPSCSTSADRI